MRFTHKSLVGKLTAALTGALMLSVIGLNLAWSQTQRGCAPSVPSRELAVLSAAINWAFKSGRITGTVAVTKPPKPAPRDRWLTRDEAARLIRAAKTAKARFYLPLFVRI
jgi:hypothetical protein